ncbi:hypothetical protein [Novosphingobium sp. HII-3]|uniref:hypothetical protein n=1 Tax=Novosphingobium sp. HII-3 TaxID=2075565 RepID=UPI000CDA6D50|nr:hypothetical protein [Novosphingobium sp. HII-3]
MGLDDRDYMKERYRKRCSPDEGNTRWNERKSRVERNDGVPLGSAGWIGKDPCDAIKSKHPGYATTSPLKDKKSSGPWFKTKNHGFHYQKNRWRPKRNGRAAKARFSWAGKLILPLILLTYGVRMYTDAKRWDFLPDFSISEPFPENGEFKVRRAYASGPTSPLTVVSGERKAVVQLLDRKSEPIFAVYIRENGTASVQVPRGAWTLRLIEGKTWHGDDELFGTNTVTEDTQKKLDFSTMGHTIDLRRRFDGNLKTVNRWVDPTF